MSDTLRVVHQSGYAHATKRQWWTMLDAHADHADIITLTETSSDTAAAAIEEWATAADWHLWHPEDRGAAECAILSRRPITHRHARRLTRLTLRTSRQAPIHAVTGRTHGIKVGVWHSPAHNGGLRPGWPTRVYLSALAGLRRIHARRPVVVAADWNADLRRPAVRETLQLPGLTWAAPSEPTHDHRVIDGMQTDLTVEGVHTLPASDGFDHRGVVATLRRNKENDR